MRHIALSLIFILSTSITAVAQSFTANVEDVGGYYRLTFTINSGDASDFTPPSFSAFEVLSGPSTSTFSSYQMVNGRTSHSEKTSFTYILSAKKSGRVSIGSASIRVNGRTFHSRPIQLNVQAGAGTGSGRASQRGQAAQSGGNIETESVQQAGSAVTMRDLFIDVTPNRTKVREQEAVLLTYRIHARVGVGLSGTQLTNKPDFKGLISQEIPLPGNQIQTEIEHRNGTTYRTGTILQYLIFPQQSGKLTIPSITFDCTIVQQDHTMDLADAFFNGGGTIGVQVRRTVPATTLQVEALPQPKPADFSGAVGTFSIQGENLNKAVKTNDVATYRITLNGLGNLKLITPPKVSFPTDFDTYAPKTNDHTRITKNGLTGQLTFDYTFVPRNMGEYTIPAVTFTYFDTNSGTYRTIRTQPIRLNVKKGEQSNADVDRQLALLRSDIRDIHPLTSSQSLFQRFAWGTPLYWITLAALTLFFIIGQWQLKHYVKGRTDVTSRRRSRAGKLAERRLHQAKALLTSPHATDFYAAVSHAIYGYVADTFSLDIADLSRERIEQSLTEKGIPAETVAQLIAAIDTCQYAQYAPGTDDHREETYHHALAAIEAINRQKH